MEQSAALVSGFNYKDLFKEILKAIAVASLLKLFLY